MELQTSLDNRKQLVKILEEFNGEPLVYTGTPSFTYEGTGFRILRDGTIDCYDESILPALKKILQEKEILPPEVDTIKLEIPVQGQDGKGLMNFVFMLYAQQHLLNRVMAPDAIIIPEAFIEALKEKAINTVDDFLDVCKTHSDGIKGVSFTEDKVLFRFFFEGRSEKVRGIIEMLGLAFQSAKKSKRISLRKKEPENEKYYMRMWLLRIGMGEKRYHESRMELLKGLKGYSAFPNEEKAQLHAEKMAQRQHK